MHATKWVRPQKHVAPKKSDANDFTQCESIYMSTETSKIDPRW